MAISVPVDVEPVIDRDAMASAVADAIRQSILTALREIAAEIEGDD